LRAGSPCAKLGRVHATTFVPACPSLAANHQRTGLGASTEMGRLSSSGRQGCRSRPAGFARRHRVDASPCRLGCGLRGASDNVCRPGRRIVHLRCRRETRFPCLHAEMRRDRPDVSRMAFYAFDLLFQNCVDLRGRHSPTASAICAGCAPTGACPAFTWWRPSRRVDPCSNGAPPIGLRASSRSDGVPATLVDPGVMGQDQVSELEARKRRAASSF